MTMAHSNYSVNIYTNLDLADFRIISLKKITEFHQTYTLKK